MDIRLGLNRPILLLRLRGWTRSLGERFVVFEPLSPCFLQRLAEIRDHDALTFFLQGPGLVPNRVYRQAPNPTVSAQ